MTELQLFRKPSLQNSIVFTSIIIQLQLLIWQYSKSLLVVLHVYYYGPRCCGRRLKLGPFSISMAH